LLRIGAAVFAAPEGAVDVAEVVAALAGFALVGGEAVLEGEAVGGGRRAGVPAGLGAFEPALDVFAALGADVGASPGEGARLGEILLEEFLGDIDFGDDVIDALEDLRPALVGLDVADVGDELAPVADGGDALVAVAGGAPALGGEEQGLAREDPVTGVGVEARDGGGDIAVGLVALVPPSIRLADGLPEVAVGEEHAVGADAGGGLGVLRRPGGVGDGAQGVAVVDAGEGRGVDGAEGLIFRGVVSLELIELEGEEDAAIGEAAGDEGDLIEAPRDGAAALLIGLEAGLDVELSVLLGEIEGDLAAIFIDLAVAIDVSDLAHADDDERLVGGRAVEGLDVVAELALEGAGDLVDAGRGGSDVHDVADRLKDLPDADGEDGDDADGDEQLGEREAAAAARGRGFRDGSCCRGHASCHRFGVRRGMLSGRRAPRWA